MLCSHCRKQQCHFLGGGLGQEGDSPPGEGVIWKRNYSRFRGTNSFSRGKAHTNEELRRAATSRGRAARKKQADAPSARYRNMEIWTSFAPKRQLVDLGQVYYHLTFSSLICRRMGLGWITSEVFCLYKTCRHI